ncbi:hypothetical protein EXIGLDRAFT_729213 [Exidia glandulosa HHB12029]|uniref:F-box domain-containing protein n=1 Tax=Exidia glandulosa HHB12029 TaxID=1314781 RepID=A0A166B5I5_EXIGL|nr:hypothetical protein EXIGLDRAFT_729213 [Exidia glandulosa HHB12029]
MPACLADLDADVLHYLCRQVHVAEWHGPTTLKALSVTNRQMRAAALSTVFSAVRIGGTLHQSGEAMRGIIAAKSLVGYIRTFTLRLEVLEDCLRDMEAGGDYKTCGARLAITRDALECTAVLAQLLMAMCGLQSLNIEPRRGVGAPFVSSVLNHGLSMAVLQPLDHVTSLSSSSCCTVFAAVCPAVIRLSICVNSESRSEEAQKWAVQPQVAFLEIDLAGVYDLTYVQELTKSLPCLAELSIKAWMDIRRELPRFEHLRALRVLRLGALDRLDMGYHPPQCGYGWDELMDNPAAMDSLLVGRRRALNEAKRLARSVFPNLEKLHIDRATFDFSRLKTDEFDELDALEADTAPDRAL